MTDVGEQARPVVSALQDAGESELLQELGLRQQAIETNLADPNTFAVELPNQVAAFNLADVRAVGAAFFKQVAVQSYPIICAPNNKDRGALEKALPNVGDAATVLSSVLVATGICPPLLAPVAALIMIKFIAGPTMATFCQGLSASIAKNAPPKSAG